MEPGQIIIQKDISEDIDSKTDLLLLQSGWSKFWGKDIYSFHNTDLDPELGLWFKQNYPSFRAIGIDWVSIFFFSTESWVERLIGFFGYQIGG